MRRFRVGPLFLVPVLTALTCHSKDPLRDGCQYATGLTKKCDVAGSSGWQAPANGFVAEELGDRDSVAVAAAAALTAATRTLSDTTGVAALGAGRDIDDLDRFMVYRHLLVYSDSRTLNDCVVAGKRTDVVAFLSTKDAVAYPNLYLGPISGLSAKMLESVFASAELRAQLEADLRSLLPAPGEARAAAGAAFSAMREKMSSDSAIGSYRYLIIRSYPQVWDELKSRGWIRTECGARAKDVALGIVVVGLDARDRLVRVAGGADLRAALKGKVSDAQLEDVALKAEVTLSAHIKTQSQRTTKVTLDSPAIVPLRWMPDKLP